MCNFILIKRQHKVIFMLIMVIFFKKFYIQYLYFLACRQKTGTTTKNIDKKVVMKMITF